MREIDFNGLTLTEATMRDDDSEVTFKAKYDGLAYRAEHACPMPKPKAKWAHNIYVCDCGGQWLTRSWVLGDWYWVRYRGESE